MIRVLIALAMAFVAMACDNTPTVTSPTQSASGVTRATVQVHTGADGLTAEQRNVRDRLIEDNKPGAIKHLYVMSAHSGQVLIYSTVRGKVTSGGKRLTPTSVFAGYGMAGDVRTWSAGIPVMIGGSGHRTSEVLQDDGTYGSSAEYLYWWDSTGQYRQVYPSAGALIVVSDTPLAVKSITMNLSVQQADKQEQPEPATSSASAAKKPTK